MVWRILDGNAVLLAPLTGEVRVLNAVGTSIWTQLTEGRSLTQIEDYLTSHYQVKRSQAAADLHHFLSELTEDGMLQTEA